MTTKNLENLIDNYRPNNQAVNLIKRTKIVLLVGISGAGKDTIKRQLLQDDQFRDIVSYTTRSPRRNLGTFEQNGLDYHFIDNETAIDMLENRQFIEAKFVHGTVYGTGVREIQEIQNQGKVAITDIDVQGVAEYKDLSQNVVAIFILPPNYDEWRRRLSERYVTTAEFEAEWPKRFDSAIKELTSALEMPYYHFVINQDLTEAARVVKEIALKPDVYNRKDDEARLTARDLLEQIKARQS